jgi:VIT1/CCC1 family predicted Fe2+/Mn2+ transporter
MWPHTSTCVGQAQSTVLEMIACFSDASFNAIAVLVDGRRCGVWSGLAYTTGVLVLVLVLVLVPILVLVITSTTVDGIN